MGMEKGHKGHEHGPSLQCLSPCGQEAEVGVSDILEEVGTEIGTSRRGHKMGMMGRWENGDGGWRRSRRETG